LTAKKVLQLLQNFLAKSNMFENIHEAKLLQSITGQMRSRASIQRHWRRYRHRRRLNTSKTFLFHM